MGNVARALVDEFEWADEVSWSLSGRSGATSSDLLIKYLPRMLDSLRANRPDVVIVVCGVNDATRFTSPSTFTRNLVSLIEKIHAASGCRLVMLTGVPPMESFPALPFPLRTFLGWSARRMATAACVLVATRDPVIAPAVCFTPILFSTDPDEVARSFATDGFHPGRLACREWGREVAKRIAHRWRSALDECSLY